MPPQVNPAGCGPIHNQESSGVEEAKSCEPEKKTAEPQKDSAAASTSTPHRATPKEVSARKAELEAGGVSQKTALTGKLNAGVSANEKAPTTANRTAARLWDSAKQTIPEFTAVAPGVLKAAEVAAKFKELQDGIKKLEKDVEVKDLEKKLIEERSKRMQEEIKEKMKNLDR